MARIPLLNSHPSNAGLLDASRPFSATGLSVETPDRSARSFVGPSSVRLVIKTQTLSWSSDDPREARMGQFHMKGGEVTSLLID